jgi:hypothetical protein
LEGDKVEVAGEPVLTRGLDHQRLVFDQNGLKEKLTSRFDARVVKEIIA